MDDPINVHGTSVRIDKLVAPSRLVCRFMHEQSTCLGWGHPGDRVGSSAVIAIIANSRPFALACSAPRQARRSVSLVPEQAWVLVAVVKSNRVLSAATAMFMVRGKRTPATAASPQARGK